MTNVKHNIQKDSDKCIIQNTLTKKAQEMIKGCGDEHYDYVCSENDLCVECQAKIFHWTNELAKANKLYNRCLNLIQGSGVDLYGLELEIMEWIYDLQNALKILEGEE